MEEQLRGRNISEKLKILSERLDVIAAAQNQVDTEIHMVSDSIDVIADTSDTIFGITEFMRQKNDELKEVSGYHRDEAEEVIGEICDLIRECQEIKDCTEEYERNEFLEKMILHMEELAEFISNKIVEGYEDFLTVAEGYEHDIEMIDHSICEFVDMSHDIQNVVRDIADSVDEITEASGNVAMEVKELADEMQTE